MQAGANSSPYADEDEGENVIRHSHALRCVKERRARAAVEGGLGEDGPSPMRIGTSLGVA